MPDQDARGILSGHGIDANPKEKAVALEAVSQWGGAHKITSGKLFDAVLGGTIPDQTREDLQAVKVLQDLFGAPVALLTSEGKFKFNGVFYKGMIWLDANSPMSLPLVFGHELSHRMEADTPVAYRALLDAVTPMLHNNMDTYEERNALEGFSALYERVSMQNQDLDGESFESTLLQEIQRASQNAEKPGVPEGDRQGARTQPGIGQDRARPDRAAETEEGSQRQAAAPEARPEVTPLPPIL